MSSSTRHFANERFAAGAIAALVALALARGADRGVVQVEHSRRSFPPFRTAAARFAIREAGARLTIESRDARTATDADLAVEVEGRVYPFHLESDVGNLGHLSAVGMVRIPLDGRTIEVRTEVTAEPDQDALTVRAIVPREAARLAAGRLAIRATVLGEPTDVFVSGFGVLEQPAAASGTATLIDFPPHPIAVASPDGPVTVQRSSLGGREPASTGIAVTSPMISEDHPQAMLQVIVGQSSAMVWQPLLRSARVQTALVRGHVTGARGERARVVGRDALGVPRLWARAREDGSFALDAPASVVEWGATLGHSNVRELVHYVPGEPAPLDLNLAPTGGVRVVVRDADTRQLLTVRLLVDPIDGSTEVGRRSERFSPQLPSTLDVLRGDTTAALPTGRYRIVATKGIEWSVDAREVDVVAGQAALVELYLRHVVPTPGVVACDLHTHARPSFDSQATPEENVLSLVAAGIDFAVSTAHNVVGDYSHAIASLGLAKEFASVPGVEVTTYNPRFGHFGVFPVSGSVPPFEHTSLGAIDRAVRLDRSRFFQLNHPRLPGGIGYFDTIGLDPHSVRSRLPARLDFDAIEVYSGFDIEHPARVEQVLRDYWALLDQGWHYTATGDSDSHCLQYRCVVKVLDHTLESGAGAGYPRTMVTVDAQAAMRRDEDDAVLDPAAIVDNLKRGHATVTSGPLIDLRVEDAGPGDEIHTSLATVHAHVRVRAAPWIDVTQVQIVTGETGGPWRIVDTFHVPSRPTEWGAGPETIEQARARAVRFDRDIDVPLGPADGWVQAIARGTRFLSDVLPQVEVAPLAFTNPVYVERPMPSVGSASSTPAR